MFLKEQAPSALNPVPIRELAAHLRLAQGFNDDGSEDALLDLYLRNATAVIERRTATALVERPYLLQTACWDRRGHLHLPVGPVTTIDSIRYIRPGSTIDLTEDDWRLEPGTRRQRLTGPSGRALRMLPHGALAEIAFTAGYGPSWNEVPDDLRQAVILLAAHCYENREGDVELDNGMPHGLAGILERHQAIRL